MLEASWPGQLYLPLNPCSSPLRPLFICLHPALGSLHPASGSLHPASGMKKINRHHYTLPPSLSSCFPSRWDKRRVLSSCARALCTVFFETTMLSRRWTQLRVRQCSLSMGECELPDVSKLKGSAQREKGKTTCLDIWSLISVKKGKQLVWISEVWLTWKRKNNLSGYLKSNYREKGKTTCLDIWSLISMKKGKQLVWISEVWLSWKRENSLSGYLKSD